MSVARREAVGPTVPPTAGIARAALGAVLLAILALGVTGAGPAAFLGSGLALVFGGLLASGRPRVLAREPLAVVALDALLAGLLVTGTGGFALLAPVPPGGARRVLDPGPREAAVATAVMAGFYLLAVGIAGGPGEVW